MTIIYGTIFDLTKLKESNPNAYFIEVEVTKQHIAQQLNDNVDPQHIGKKDGTSAIDTATRFNSDQLDGKDIVMVTSKPDLDSIGAMVILTAHINQDPDFFTSKLNR